MDDWVDVHSLRTWRSGDQHHMDLHLVVPRFYTADRLHALSDGLEYGTLRRAGLAGDIIVHNRPLPPPPVFPLHAGGLPDPLVRIHPPRAHQRRIGHPAGRADP